VVRTPELLGRIAPRKNSRAGQRRRDARSFGQCDGPDNSVHSTLKRYGLPMAKLLCPCGYVHDLSVATIYRRA
jgi:hypothetical protein